MNYMPLFGLNVKKKRMPKSKIDTSEFKKLHKALNIMLLSVQEKVDPKRRDVTSLQTEFTTDRITKNSSEKDVKYLLTTKVGSTDGRNKKVTYSFQRLYMPARCANLVLLMRNKYSRMSEIDRSERKLITELVEVSEESIAWAECVAAAVGCDVTKDKKIIISSQEKVNREVITIVKANEISKTDSELIKEITWDKDEDYPGTLTRIYSEHSNFIDRNEKVTKTQVIEI